MWSGMLSIETVAHDPMAIHIIHDPISILLVKHSKVGSYIWHCCREDYYLEILCHLIKELNCSWSNQIINIIVLTYRLITLIIIAL